MIFGPLKSDVYLYAYAAAIHRGKCDPDVVARKAVADYVRFQVETRDADDAAREKD